MMTGRSLWLLAAVALALNAQAADTSSSLRICLAPATAQAALGNSADMIGAVRETFTSFLTGPSVAVKPLDSRLAGQAREEAKLAECPYVLFPTVRHERKSSGMLGRIAAGAIQSGAWEAAGRAPSSTTRVLAGTASAGAASYSVYSQIRSRDVLNLEYRLESGDGRVLVDKKSQRNAGSDGEDLLTPLVQSAAEDVMSMLSQSTR
jgi:outer membrane lipoprotein SlyB